SVPKRRVTPTSAVSARLIGHVNHGSLLDAGWPLGCPGNAAVSWRVPFNVSMLWIRGSNVSSKDILLSINTRGLRVRCDHEIQKQTPDTCCVKHVTQ
ncbi:hypothetical protein BaRGS_00012000, partial [Batillaria attramentaria]